MAYNLANLSYNPANWYWIVAGNTDQVWSSAGAAYVPVTDATYVEWLAGNTPTRIESEASLQQVLTTQYPPGWPPTLAQQATAAMAAGLTITSTGTPALSGIYAVDASTQAHIQAETVSILLNGTFADGTTSVVWPDMADGLHTFGSVAEFKIFAGTIAGYVAALFKCINGASTVLPSATTTIP